PMSRDRMPSRPAWPSRNTKAWPASGFLTRSTIQFSSGVPVAIDEKLSPTNVWTTQRDIGIFAQDQWTVRKLTLNMGLRWDHSNGSTPAAHIMPTRFVAPFDIPAVNNIPNFNDINPRLGAAYDLFGDGKTAVKVSLGRYVFNTYNRVSANSPLNS